MAAAAPQNKPVIPIIPKMVAPVTEKLQELVCTHCKPESVLVATGPSNAWLHCNACGCRFVKNEDGELEYHKAEPGGVDHPRCREVRE